MYKPIFIMVIDCFGKNKNMYTIVSKNSTGCATRLYDCKILRVFEVHFSNKFFDSIKF
jgi:hypothetical protein